MLRDRIDIMISNDLARFDTAARNHAALAGVCQREIKIGRQSIILQHNHARAVSTGASVKPRDIAARPCFLCHDNRPPEQGFIEYGKWEILLNPYPIMPRHLTIACKEHTPQHFDPADLAALSTAMMRKTVLYNGPTSGASAPDHLHYQAFDGEDVPIWYDCHIMPPEQIDDAVSIIDRLPAAIYIQELYPNAFINIMRRVLAALPVDNTIGEPAVNALCFSGSFGFNAVIVPRRRHRPEQYTSSADDSNGVMVSPGALDVSGIVVTPRLIDFQRIDAETITSIFNQTGYTAAELKEMLQSQ